MPFVDAQTPAPLPMSALPAPPPRADVRATELWDQHFREPAAALDGVRRVLALPSAHDERTLAWAELTEGFHRPLLHRRAGASA